MEALGLVEQEQSSSARTSTALKQKFFSLRRCPTQHELHQAEYEGLLTGLTAAAHHRWTPLTVIGDSNMIIQQMRHYKAPLKNSLVEKYARARRLADSLEVLDWRYHPHAANRMADAAANLAMDECASSQVLHPTTRPEHEHIASLLGGDLAYWRRGH